MSGASAGSSSCGDGHRRRRRRSPWVVGVERSCCAVMQGRELMLGAEGWGSLVLVAAWELVGELVMLGRRCLVGMVAVVVVVVGRSWALVARMGVGVGLRGLDLAGLVGDWSMFAGGIFLLRRYWRASGWCLGVVWMAAGVAGMCLRVADRSTL